MARAAGAVFDRSARPAAEPALPSRPAAAAAIEPVIGRLIAGQHWRWIPVIGLATAVAFLIAFGIYVGNVTQNRGVGLAWALYATLPHFLVYAALCPVLYRALHEVVAGERRVLGIVMLAAWGAIAIAGSTIACYLGLALRESAWPTLGGLYGSLVAPPLGPPYQAMNLTILLSCIAALGVALGIRQRDRAGWEAAQAQLRGARLEAQLADAKLQALQAQINPHFLLNSLNAVAGLVQSGDRDRAYDAISALGGLLQAAMRNGRAADMTLGEELQFLERYLQLCELRFARRFRYHVSIPEELRARRVPALIVQPLIENAIRHGMLPREPLSLDVRAYRDGPGIAIEVEDDGRGIQAGQPPARAGGQGIGNVRERLRIFFGEAASLTIEPRAPRGTRARIAIPA